MVFVVVVLGVLFDRARLELVCCWLDFGLDTDGRRWAPGAFCLEVECDDEARCARDLRFAMMLGFSSTRSFAQRRPAVRYDSPCHPKWRAESCLGGDEHGHPFVSFWVCVVCLS